eukprot:2998768-Alexandrium_andersonii.AAC.1
MSASLVGSEMCIRDSPKPLNFVVGPDCSPRTSGPGQLGSAHEWMSNECSSVDGCSMVPPSQQSECVCRPDEGLVVSGGVLAQCPSCPPLR